MFSPKFPNQDKDDLVSTVFSELKLLGVKLPKLKKFKINVLKSDKPVQEPNCKIFGVNLSDQEWVSVGECHLPKFLAISTAYLQGYLKNEIGLFRKAGNVARQKKLRLKLEDGGDLKDSEPNDVASLLKQWLRELPEPLIPPCLQDLFIRCLEIEENCITACLLICLLLSPEQLHTIKYLLNFMADIASNCDTNKMDSYNLALIMAPNIFGSHESTDKIRNCLVKQHTSILKKLIENCNKIGEIPPGVTFQYPIIYSELDSSSDVLDSNANKSKRKVKNGPVQEIFIGFKKFVGQNSTPLSKNATPEPYTESSVLNPHCKRKVEPEQYLSAVKRLAVSKDDLDNHELEVTPKRNGLLANTRDKSARNHVRRKSIGALLRRKDKKSKSNRLPSKECQRPLSVATAEIPIINICDANLSPQTTTSGETKNVCRSESIKKSWSDCPLPSFGTELSVLPTITVQLSEGFLSGRPNVPSQHRSKPESFTNNKNILFEKDTKKNSESRKQNNICEASKEEKVINAVTKNDISEKYSSNLVETNLGKNENSNLDTKNIDSVFHPSSVRRSPRISATSTNHEKSENINQDSKNIDFASHSGSIRRSLRLSASVRVSSSINADLLHEDNPDKENVPFESGLLQKVGLPRQEAFIMKNTKQKSAKAVSGNENINNKCEEFSPKKKIQGKRNSLNCSSFKDGNTKQENGSASGKKSLRRKTRHGSLIRGQPNSVKSGLRLTLPRHCANNSSFLFNSPTIDLLKCNTTFKNDVSLTESPLLQSLDLSLSSLLHNFCLNSPTPEFSFDTGENGTQDTRSQLLVQKPNENDSAKEISINKSNSEGKLEISPGVLKTKDKITPPLRRPKRLSSKSDSELQRKKTGSKLKRSDSYTVKPSEDRLKSLRNKNISPKVSNKVLSPQNIKNNNSSIVSTPQSQELDCNLFKTPNYKCSPNSDVWMSGSTFLNSIASPQEEEIANKRESIAMILKNNTGHVQAKVNLYDNNLQSSGSKDSVSHERMLRSSQKSYSASKTKTPISRGFDSSSKSSSVKNRMKYQRSPLPPPPKFTLTDLSMSPKANHPLKEVTNFNLEVNDSKIVKSNTPIKSVVESSPMKQNTPNSDHKAKKAKRNSFHGHTPYKLSKKVSRSESSPACQRNFILRE